MSIVDVGRLAAARAGQVDPKRLLRTAVAMPFFALGWLAGRAVWSLAFFAAAAKIGWQDGHRGVQSTGDRRPAAPRVS